MRNREWHALVARRASALVLSVVASAVLSGCGDRAGQSEALPAAEFLFAAGDSTYWVRSDGEGMRVRSAPILLTQVDGRLFEVFISDDGAEYPDASFATSRLWARALQGKDSTLLFADSTVMQELARWRSAHPREAEIDPNDEEAPDDPHTVVQDEIEILDVHGPYLTFEHVLNADIEGGPPHQHRGRRYVVDVRTGHKAQVADVLGAAEGTRVIRDAQVQLRQLLDSIRTAGAAGDDRAEVAVETLNSFVFDSSSFGITDVAREPAIGFMIPGHAEDGEALALHLPPLVVKAPAWWPAVRATLPEWSRDSMRVQWERDAYTVVAQPSADGETLALVLRRRGLSTSTREWPVATVGAPAYQLIALESPPLDSAGRAALARAFDFSTSLDGLVQRASRRFIAPPNRDRVTATRRLTMASFDRTPE